MEISIIFNLQEDISGVILQRFHMLHSVSYTLYYSSLSSSLNVALGLSNATSDRSVSPKVVGNFIKEFYLTFSSATHLNS